MKQFAAEDIWTDVSMREYDVLYTLSKCPEPVRLTELNRHVLLSQPALSRLVDRLAERGLVRARRPTPPTGAASGSSLTAAGRTVQRAIGRRHARGVARAMTAGLTRGELAQLETICRKLAAPATSSEVPMLNEYRTVPARRRQRRHERPVLDAAAGRPHRRARHSRWPPGAATR